MKAHALLNPCVKLILFCSLVFFFQPRQSFALAPNAPDNLRSCDKTHPVGTDDKPYFGWYVNDPDDNEVQSAYQILVASSLDNIKTDQIDLWDSGRVNAGKQN